MFTSGHSTRSWTPVKKSCFRRRRHDRLFTGMGIAHSVNSRRIATRRDALHHKRFVNVKNVKILNNTPTHCILAHKTTFDGENSHPLHKKILLR